MNRWINPLFWNHPTPINVLLLMIGTGSFVYGMLWLLWLFANIFRILPLPPF